MNVLSLFDGVSCGQIALERAGIKVDNYYASEIYEPAIKTTLKNYPNTQHIGNVLDVVADSLPKIDLLIGGTPCRNLSQLVVNNPNCNQGLEGKDSKLFYEYVRLFNELKPKYFFLENVESMKDKDKDIITSIMGVEPIMIDSALVSAQERKRYYWTNIPNVTPPEDKNIYLKDIVEQDVDEKYFYTDIPYTYNGSDKRVEATLHLWKYEMLQRVYNLNHKAPTLTACRGGHKQKKVYQNGRCRRLTPLEYERLQTVPEGYTEGVADSHRYNMLGDGWTVDVVAHIFKGLK